jgi:hypothetical protein
MHIADMRNSSPAGGGDRLDAYMHIQMRLNTEEHLAVSASSLLYTGSSGHKARHAANHPMYSSATTHTILPHLWCKTTTVTQQSSLLLSSPGFHSRVGSA